MENLIPIEELKAMRDKLKKTTGYYSGKKDFTSVIDKSEYHSIVQQHVVDGVSYRKLGEKYKVSRNKINRIIKEMIG